MKNIQSKKYILSGLFLIAVSSLILFFSLYQKNKTNPKVKGALNEKNVVSLENFNPYLLPQIKPQAASSPNALAEYAILLDAKTGFPLFQKNADTPVPIASVTKIITALIILDEIDLNKIVSVSPVATNVIGSKINLRVGEQIKAGDLLRGLLIKSGNDAAYALAETNGSVPEFVEKMNQKAQKLGLTKTHFADPAGLDTGNVSTARELASLTRYALSIKEFSEIVKTPVATITSIDGGLVHELKNSNRLVTDELYYPGAMGVKTGYTPEAGHILVSAAKNSGTELIGVVMKTLEDTKVASAKESWKLLDWGFNSFMFY